MGLWTGYRQSLKAVEVEELLDLLLYRPPAYLLALAISRTRATPNGVTLAAGCTGVAAGILVGIGTGEFFWIPPILLLLYNILDCADGMLARMQGNGSRIGRLFDGIADYAVMTALYIGIGLSLAARHPAPLTAWALTIAAGFSTTLQAILLDFYRNRFLDRRSGRVNVLTDDLDEFRREYDALRGSREQWGKKGVLWIYLRYSSLQRGLVSRGRNEVSPTREPQGAGPGPNSALMRGWTFLGPTTGLSILIAGLLARSLEPALWTIVVAGNTLALILIALQKRVDASAT